VLCQPDDVQKQDAVPPHADLNTTQDFQVRSDVKEKGKGKKKVYIPYTILVKILETLVKKKKCTISKIEMYLFLKYVSCYEKKPSNIVKNIFTL